MKLKQLAAFLLLLLLAVGCTQQATESSSESSSEPVATSTPEAELATTKVVSFNVTGMS